MATVGLAVAGGALGGPLGQAIGAAVGSYIDNAWLFPLLFPQDPAQGQRIQELQIQGADEGHPRTRCYGRETRVAGTIIWVSPLKETKTTEEIGGKGGPVQELDVFTYSVDIALEWCTGPPDGLGIEAVDRIYADVGLVFDNTPNISLAGTDITLAVFSQFEWDPDTETMVEWDRRIELTAPANGTDLSLLRSGVDVVSAGWTETDYNGTFRCRRSFKLADDSTQANLAVPLTTSATGEAAGNSITLDQTIPQFDSSQLSAVTNHLGTETQTADATIEAVEDTGQVPGFRGEAYSVIQDFQLARFGNRIPNFQARIVVDSTATLDDIFSDILEDSDLDVSEWDVTALTSLPGDGYVSRGPAPVVSTLQPLMLAFNVLAQEADGALVFLERANVDSVTVTATDLAAHEEGNRDYDRPHRVMDVDGQVPPAEVDVKYVDQENFLQPGMARERGELFGSVFTKAVLELPITLTGGTARDIAAKVLYTASTGKRQFEIALPPSYMGVQESDVVSYVVSGETFTLIADRVEEGENGLRMVSGPQELAANLVHASPHDLPAGNATGPELYVPYDCQVTVLDCCALRSSEVNTPGAYFAVVARDPDVVWRGATLFESTDGGTNFGAIRTMPNAATMGRVTAIPSTTVDPIIGWDFGSTVTVVLDDGALSSRTKLEVSNGANRIFLGEEIVGFITATLTSANTYDLTGLLRGLAGTEEFIDEHVIGERAVLLNAPGIEFQSFELGAAGSTRQYKAVSPGGDEADFTARTLRLDLNTVRPYSVVHTRAERGNPTTNDWRFFWTRRSRSFFRIFSQAAPLNEPTEDYLVDVYDAPGTTVLRTITSTATANGSVVDPTVPDCIYDEADQVTDFGSAQSTIRVRIIQVSDLLSRGKDTDLLVFTG